MNTQNEQTQSTRIVRSGLRRPNWICRDVKQNVVLVRDSSGSMEGQKATDASNASLDLVAELANVTNKDGFNVAVVDFSTTAAITSNLDSAATLNGNIQPISTSRFGGRTNITTGLDKAKAILDSQKKNEEVAFLRPVVIAFSDGCHNEGPDPNNLATKLKEIADLVTVAFGDDADEDMLKSLASTHQHFYRCRTGRELRSFLAAVGATMTGTLASRTNATQALTTIQK